MNRYSSHLARYYRSRGVELRCARPTDRLSQRSAPRWTKHVTYVEKLVLFPLQVLLLRVLHRPDVVHITDHSNAPWALAAVGAPRLMISVHDLIAQRAALGQLPEHRPRLPGRVYQSIIRAGLRRATDHVSVSHTTRLDAERMFPEVRHHVVYNWVDPVEPSKATPPTPRDHVLIVSTGGWRKTRWRAVEIARRLAAELDEIPVVLVGPPLSSEERARIHQRDVEPDEVVVLSDLPEQDLQHQYAKAVVLVQASRYEGFGWPIVEANTHGTPVVAAAEPIFREVGHNARFIDDVAQADWAGIAEWVRSPAAGKGAHENASRFTYTLSAAALDSLLNDGELQQRGRSNRQTP